MSMSAETTMGKTILPPSPWVRRFAGLVPAHGRVLDLAAGGGRHARYFNELGLVVTAIDRDVTALAPLAGPRLEVIEADLEDGSPWPLDEREFAGIVVSDVRLPGELDVKLACERRIEHLAANRLSAQPAQRHRPEELAGRARHDGHHARSTLD